MAALAACMEHAPGSGVLFAEQSIWRHVQMSRLALPVFMARCDGVLRAYAEDQARALAAAAPQHARCTAAAGGAFRV